MFGSFLITLREGLEAALIIGIILAYLAKLGQRRHFGTVWLGTAAAILIILGAGFIFFATAAEFKGRAEQLFEGLVSLLAVGVLTYMIFWMRKQAINIKRELHARIDAALEKRSVLALAALAFVAVLREGIETVLFMFAATRAVSPISSVIGGNIGIVPGCGAGLCSLCREQAAQFAHLLQCDGHSDHPVCSRSSGLWNSRA